MEKEQRGVAETCSFVNIESAAKTGIEEHQSQTKKSGLFSGGGLGFTIGKRTEKDSTKEKVLKNEASTIGSVEGNVTIKAGEKVGIEGSNLIAGEDINITGKQVNIDNSTDTYDYERKYELKQSGLSVSLGGKIINTAPSKTRKKPPTSKTTASPPSTATKPPKT